MQHISKAVIFLSASVVSLGAQTLTDHFNDNSRDAAQWDDPFIEGGNGQLLEQSERVEFTAPGGVGETDVSQSFRQYPTYDQPWQAQAVVAMGTGNFSSLGDVGTMSIGMGSGDDWISMGYGAGILSPGPSATGWSQVGRSETGKTTTSPSCRCPQRSESGSRTIRPAA